MKESFYCKHDVHIYSELIVIYSCHMKHKNFSGFTLIEMLIVIVIIGILAAALVPRLQSVQARARDTKRKVDLRSIYNANEIYFVDNGAYPLMWCTYSVPCASNSQIGVARLSQLSGIMASIPLDPINNVWGWYVDGLYAYMYWWHFNNPHTYDLLAQLENKQDPDRCWVKGYKYYNDINYRCTAFGGAYSNGIYDVSPNVKNQ